MNRTWTVCLLAVLVTVTTLFAAGTVTDVTFYAPSLGYDKHVFVYLPDGYDEASRYPVTYFLHGIGNPGIDYSFTASILDALIASGMMEPMIFVRPNGQCPPYAGSMYTNSELYGAYEDYVVHDVIAYIDSHYSTLPYAEARAIMGHSMGGYGALNAGFKHSELYGSVVSLSGFSALDWGLITAWRQILIAENGGAPPYSWSPLSGWFSGVVFTACGAFSPNLSNPPFMVDFVIGADGDFNYPVIEHWQTVHMPPAMAAEHLTPATEQRILLDCGTQDELGFYSINVVLANALAGLGVPHTFTSFTGGHATHLVERITLGLLYLDQQLCVTDAGNYRTYTAGQWGQEACKGNNAACIRDSYFDALYPAGLTVGNGYTLTFTSSAAVGAALPSGGAPSMLNHSMTDPTAAALKPNGGSFAGEVIALKLNIDYAAITGYRYLDGLVVGNGYGGFSGMSGGMLLSVAEDVLGGNAMALPAGETLSSLHHVLAMVNGNFTGRMVTDPELMLEVVYGPCGPDAGAFNTTPEVMAAETPGTYVLHGNYPNPFNPSTSIAFDLAEAGVVSLKVYNLMGQEVATLVHGLRNSGHHSVNFDATGLSSGVYMYKLETGGFSATRKMLLMR